MKRKSRFSFSITPLKRRVITFASPDRVEKILLFLFLFFFFIMDLAQNKFLDNGINFNVIVFWNLQMRALFVWQIFLILFHIVLVTLFVRSLKSKATDMFYDFIVGTLALFGVAILLAGVVNQIYSPTINFLFLTFRSIDFYHLGVYIEIFAGLYWTVTK